MGMATPKAHKDMPDVERPDPEDDYPYHYVYRGVKMDPYRIMWLYDIRHAAQQHAIKKLLRAGRGQKSLLEDVVDARESLNRMLEMMDEDGFHD